VVLSACQTSQGKLAVGEGVMSLARAFRYAGVPSVLASMWEAEDASAKFIMEIFYEKLSAGLPKDEALSEAKRAYLAEDAHYSFRSPFFWSNFVLVGDVGELRELGKLGKNEIRLLVGLFLTLFIYFYFRTKNRKKHAPPH
jgi:CHAT domain-containing protein